MTVAIVLAVGLIFTWAFFQRMARRREGCVCRVPLRSREEES